MSKPDFEIEMSTAGDDCIVGIKPPIDNAFREDMFDIMDDMQLIKEIVVRGGTFFETKHATDGSPFSELRISGTALSVAGVRLAQLAHLSKEVIEKQENKQASVSPFLKSGHGRRQLFDGATG
jgi:hypothetical protein